MKKIIFLIIGLGLFCSCINQHVRFVKGTVVVCEKTIAEVSLAVDTTSDGLPDLWASVTGPDAFQIFERGDTVLVDIGTIGNSANIIPKLKEKSKQGALK